MTEQQPNILLLCADEQAANLDKRALREAGFPRVWVMTSGIEAAQFLAGLGTRPNVREPDVIVCLNRLADMEGEQFCAIVRQHPRLLAFPILLVMPNDNEVQQLRTLGCGASALIGRPYSVDMLKKQIMRIAKAIPQSRQLLGAAMKTDTSAFDDALATYGVLLRQERQPEDYFKVGMRCLEEHRWNVAIAAFEHALRDAQIKAEAELGVAAAYKGKGDMQRFRIWLARASESFVRAKRWSRARTAYARLLQHDNSARNPFLAEAHRLIRGQEYEQAADVLVQSLAFLEKKKQGDRLARVCLAAEDTERMFSALEATLLRDAPQLHDYLTQEIRESLDVMIRQRQERQKQQAEERKWQLAQSLGVLPQQEVGSENRGASEEKEQMENSAPVQEKMPGAAGKGATAGKAVAGFGEDETKSVVSRRQASVKSRPMPGKDAYVDENSEDNDILMPFGDSQELEHGKKTKFNELLSVVKLTWHLARKSRKN